MANQLMTTKQYELLETLNTLIIKITEEDDTFQELVNDTDIFRENIDCIQGDIERTIDIFDFIKRYKKGLLQDTGTIGISNTMGVVIVDADGDYVFGYMPLEEGYKYFLSEIEYKISDEDDEENEPTPMFTIGEDGMELSLSDAMRINF